MKLTLITLISFISLTAFGKNNELPFTDKFHVKPVVMRGTLMKSHLELYKGLNLEKRMIAGKKDESPKQVTWIDSLRTKLQGTGGKIRM